MVEQGVDTLVEEAIDSVDNSMSQEAESETASKSGTAETSGSDTSTSESVSNIDIQNDNGELNSVAQIKQSEC